MSGEMLRKIGRPQPPRAKTDTTKELGIVVLAPSAATSTTSAKHRGLMLEVNGFEVYDIGIDQPKKPS